MTLDHLRIKSLTSYQVITKPLTVMQVNQAMRTIKKKFLLNNY